MKKHKDKYMDRVEPRKQLSEHYWMRCSCPGCVILRKEKQLKYNGKLVIEGEWQDKYGGWNDAI